MTVPVAALLAVVLAQAQARPLTVKGSDTIGGELGPALARAFEAGQPGRKVLWEALGSKTAFVGLLDGSADLGAASRQVQESEYKEAQKLGVELQEFVLGFDGIALIVNRANAVPALTLEQVSQLYQGKIANWKELGGPDAPAKLVARPTYSGTRSFFDEKALRHGNAKGPEQLAPTAAVIESNEQILPLVERERGAVAYVGLGSIGKDVRAVPLLTAAGKAVTPDVKNVRDSSYPLVRTLYLYSRGAPAGDAAALLRFVLSAPGQKLVAAHGFVPRGASEADVQVDEKQAQEQRASGEPLRVRFAPASVAVDEASQQALAGIAARIAKEPRRLLLVGHTDSTGSVGRNLKISALRARSVAETLARLHVPKQLIEIRAQSSDAPIASNETDAGRDQNRRVDVFVLPRAH